MKSIIVTFSDSYNFGASLQAFALMETVKKYVETVEILNIKKSEHREVQYLHGLKGLIFNPVIWINRKRLNEGNIRFEEFTREFLNLTQKNYASYQSLLDCPPEADVFISGSDQVFNPNRADPTFYLNFVNNDSSKITSYAASLGINIIPKDKHEIISNYLKRFDRISLRERQSVSLFEKCFGIKPDNHIDPVFLLSQEEWIKLERRPCIEEKKYVLVYLLYRPRDINKIIKEIKRITRLPVYVIERNAHRLIKADKILIECGPSEFIWLIHHAEMVFTTSFHGTAFSLIFNKKLKVVNNINSPDRIQNLLDVLEYYDCIDKSIEDIWYSDSNLKYLEKIKLEQKRSYKYLQEICNESDKYNIKEIW